MRKNARILVLLVLSACTGDKLDDTATVADAWTLAADGMDAAWLSVWGSAADDVWVVGADPGDGPAVAHFDGAAWSTLATGTTGDLWWVTSTSVDTLWMGGEGGRVLRYSRATSAFVETMLDPAITVFGVWGTSDDEVWAVGGDVTVGSHGAQVWRFDGASWARVDVPSEAAAAVAVYKVWGRSASDLYAVGTEGIGLRWDGSAWAMLDTGTDRNLFTVHGTASEEIAVGGQFSGTLVAGSGAWSDQTPTLAPQVNGVYAGGAAPVAVGAGGVVYVREGSTWVEDPRGRVTDRDLHAVWVDPDGGIWTVGGNLSSFPLDQGIVAYGGDREVPAL